MPISRRNFWMIHFSGQSTKSKQCTYHTISTRSVKRVNCTHGSRIVIVEISDHRGWNQLCSTVCELCVFFFSFPFLSLFRQWLTDETVLRTPCFLAPADRCHGSGRLEFKNYPWSSPVSQRMQVRVSSWLAPSLDPMVFPEGSAVTVHRTVGPRSVCTRILTEKIHLLVDENPRPPY